MLKRILYQSSLIQGTQDILHIAYNIFISPYNIFQQSGEAAEPGRGQEPAVLRGGG